MKDKFPKLKLTQVLRYFKYISLIERITKYCIRVFCIPFSAARETVNTNI